MKLIMESWRGFVKEAAISEAKRLAIFDFDGTIGFTGAKVAVLNKKTGKTDRLSDKEFLAFLKTLPTDEERTSIEEEPNESENYKVDYSEYATVSNDTVENEPVLNKMAEFARDKDTSLFVLTARAPGEEGPGGDPKSATDDIQRYLADREIPIEADHIMALAGKPKAEFIDGLLRQNKSVTELVVYEDSKSNLDSIDSMMEHRYSNLYSIIHPATGRDVRGRLVKYSLFLVDGETITPQQPTKADRVRSDKAERQAAHKAMSKYLAEEHKMNLIPRGRQEGIINVFSGNLSVPKLIKSLRDAIEDVEIDTVTLDWGKHIDTFSNILYKQIR